MLGAPDGVAAMPLPESLLEGPADDVQRLRQVLSTLPEVADAARPAPDHPWAFVDRVAVDVAAVRAAALRLDEALPLLPPALRPALDAARTPADLAFFADLLAAGHPLAVLDESRQPRWEAAVRSAVDGADAFAAAPQPGLDTVTPAVLGLPIEDIDAAARAAAASGFFGRRRRLKAVRERLAPVLRPEAAVKPRAVPGLTAELVRLRAAVRTLAGSITAIPGLRLPAGWDPWSGRDELVRGIDEVRRAGARVEPAARLAGPLRAALATGADPRPVRAVASAASELAAAASADLDGWAGETGLLRRWTATGPARALADPELGSLRRWLDLLRHLEPLRAAHLDEARAAVLGGRLDLTTRGWRTRPAWPPPRSASGCGGPGWTASTGLRTSGRSGGSWRRRRPYAATSPPPSRARCWRSAASTRRPAAAGSASCSASSAAAAAASRSAS